MQNTVFWGGAPLREAAGECLVRHGVKLVAWGGWCVSPSAHFKLTANVMCGGLDSTEAGPLARSSLEENADPADWMYMRLVDYYQFNWCPMADDAQGW